MDFMDSQNNNGNGGAYGSGSRNNNGNGGPFGSSQAQTTRVVKNTQTQIYKYYILMDLLEVEGVIVVIVQLCRT